MKYFYSLVLFFSLFVSKETFAQNSPEISVPKIYDDANGKIITNPQLIESIIAKRKGAMAQAQKKISKTSAAQTPVEMCSNGGFEQHETTAGNTHLKHFLYTTGDPSGPTECKAITNIADQNINIFDPNNTNIMATTVPANYIDKYIGDIKAFDQYALKVNYSDSYSMSSSVQGKRYKTNNENFLKFNFKVVLQTVYDSGHKDNQPFFKARVLNKNREVVSEFCLTGNEKNCIYTKIPDGGSSYVTLYTANWQSGMLDISAIPNNEEFTVEFIASRCGLMGHFGYAYIDDICFLHSNENVQGTVELDPLNKICPTTPVSVCGTYTIPNSGGISATVKKITLNLYDSTNKIIYSSSVPSTHDKVNKKFCFNLNASDFPNVTSANYNVGAVVEYDISGSSCSGTNFGSANDPDANPGWDISFMNCSSDCTIDLQTAKIYKCDTNGDGTEVFNLSDLESNLVSSTSGLSFSYFKNYNDAFSNINSITNYTSFNSPSATIYVRVSKSESCFKIIHANVEVKNPTVNISGILNVCSGSTVLTATAGSSYLWNTGEKTQSITVNAIGTYSVTVTDSYGCVNTGSVVIEASQTAVLPTLEVKQPSCNSSTGEIKVTSPASEYSFDNGVTWVKNNTLSNVYPGTYKVKVKTVNGCISYAQLVTIVLPASTYPNYTYKEPLFCGDKGSITITTLAAYYSFDCGATWGTSNTQNGLDPGIYKIMTKDINGCLSYINNVYIYGVSLGYPQYTFVRPACNTKGSITIENQGDLYTFDGGTTWVTSNTLSNLSPGTYSIAFKNNLGCLSDYQYVYLNDYSEMYPDYEIIHPVCGIDGSIIINTPGKEFSFDGGVTWLTTNQKDDLKPGSYQIQVKDENGCLSQKNWVYINTPYLDSPYITLVQPTCTTNGTITVNTLNDFYSFDGGATWTTVNQKSLPPGSYQVLVKNNLGCVSQTNYIYLNNPNIPLTDYTVVQPTCDTKGSITINTVAKEYSFDGGNTWGTSNTLNNLSSYSSYSLRIKSADGCISNDVYVQIMNPRLPNPDYEVINPSCGNIGSIKFNTVADSYSIDGGYTWSTNPVFSPLKEGYYYLVIKNKNGCLSETQFVYLDSENSYMPKVTVTQPSCGTNGSIIIDTVSDFYSINGGSTWVTTNSFTNLPDGYYYVQTKDKNGCISNHNTVYLKEFHLPEPKFTSTQPTCGVGGSITFTTVSDFYSIDGGNTWSTSNTFTNLKAGYYNPRIKNSLGCTSYYSSVYLNEFYLDRPDYSVVQPTCGNTGSITIATVADQYSFDGGSTWTTNPKLTGLKSGNYYLVIKNAKGCTSYAYGLYVNIIEYFLPKPIVKVVQPSCGKSGSISIGTSASQYSFDGGKTFTTNPILTAPFPGSYSIVIKNDLGCVSYPYYVYIKEYFTQSPRVSVVQPTCSSPYGTIYINTPADQYSYDNGKTWTTDNSKANLSGGSYYILTKNAQGCISNASYAYVISPPSIPAAPLVTVKQPSACGVTDGSITINTTASSYSFNDGASWSSVNTKTNLGAGTYIIKIKSNSYSCESLTTVVNLDSGVLIAAPTFIATQPTCSVSTGSISITSDGDSYSFDNGLSYTYGNTKTDLFPGTYYIKYRSKNGCTSEAQKVIIQKPSDLPAPQYTVAQPDCSNPLGSIIITTPAALYSFDKGVTFTSSNEAKNLGPGTYDLMIKDAAGCISFISSVTVIAKPNITETPKFIVTHPTGCSSNMGSIKITTTANEYSFDDGKTWVNSSTMSLPSGSYYLRIKIGADCPSEKVLAVINAPSDAPKPPKYTVSQPLSCTNAFGNITITDSAAEYSFDDGKTYSSNSTSGNLAPGNYLIKVKNAIGCESNSVSVTINKPTDYPPLPTVSVQQIDCLNASASITVTNSGAKFSIDNGLTWQTSNIFKNLSPNPYKVLIQNSKGCISEVTEVTIDTFVNPTPKPTAPSKQEFCVQENAKISNLLATGNHLTWYDSLTGGNVLNANTLLTNANTYYVSQKIGDCEGERIPVSVIIFQTPAPTSDAHQTFCISENANLNKITITGNQIKWYDAASSGNLLSSSTVLEDAKTYYATQTLNNCESVSRTPVTVSLVASTIVANDYLEKLCDLGNDKKEVINLTEFESKLLANTSGYQFKYYDAKMQVIPTISAHTIALGNTDIFVNISTSKGCDTMVKLSFILNEVPTVELPKEIEICSANDITLDAGSGYTQYEWTYNGKFYSDQQWIKPTNTGNYSVTVTNAAGCSFRTSTQIVSPVIPKIATINITNASAIIIMESNNAYEYSLDGIHWQNNNLFSNLSNGVHSVYVRIKGKICSITQGSFTIFDIPHVITPNGDHVNDTWKIEGIEVYKGSTVQVFNRHGEIVLQTVIASSFEWNGKLAGRPLPTDNYFYVIKLSDGRVLTGNLLIKNRN